MAGAAASNGPPPAQDNLYAREVRFGVVMYGGVSLAIYINGVTNELYEMACATPKVGDNQGTDRTRDVYRKASWLLGNPGLRTSYLAHLRDPQSPDPFRKGAPLPLDQRTRFVVDTIAGTSAGGINGLFLAKALANGQEFAPLKQLWILEGDLARLLNDRASYTDLEFARNDSPPQSLLNSDRMYVKLLEALQGRRSRLPRPAARRWSMNSICSSRRRIFEGQWCRSGCSTRSSTRSGTSRFITFNTRRSITSRAMTSRTKIAPFLLLPHAVRRRSLSPSSR
jgi:hypothetical protein